MISCRDCLRALHHFLDRELSDDDVGHVRLHLDSCPPCQELLTFEMSIRRLIRVRCLEQHAPETLRERILAALEAERLRAAQRQRRRGTAPGG